MAKYIDADRLRAEIGRLEETHERNLDKPMERGRIGHAHGYVDCCDEILSFIDSLQQEPQEVDLEKEIEKYYYDNFAFISSAHTPTKDIVSDIATHFYERGQKNAANKYDEIEYNRQRAEDESLGKTLDEAANKYADGENPTCLCGECLIKTFIAGAKWMAGQGVSWEDEMTYYDGFLLYGKDERAFTMEGNFNEGDEVIVQIRKKEESK